jgi:hypothetical protein
VNFAQGNGQADCATRMAKTYKTRADPIIEDSDLSELTRIRGGELRGNCR